MIIYFCAINRLFPNIRSEYKTPMESFKLLGNFLNKFCETTEILNKMLLLHPIFDKMTVIHYA